MLRIAHLIDDTQPGGVTRYLDFLRTDPAMARIARHQVVPVPRARPSSIRVEADIIVSHLTVTWRGLPGLMLLRAQHPGTPLIHIEHSYTARFMAANVSAKARFLTLLRSAYSLFDRVVAVSGPQAAWMERRTLVAPGALHVIRPCVDLAPFRALPLPGLKVRTFGAIGRFDIQKGFDLLIRAFRQLPGDDLRLRLIGDGPELAELKALADGDPRISFPGFAADPAEALATCDAVVMPSRWEAYGLVALEAMAARRPVLAASVDGLKDHIAEGAIAVPDMTLASWSDALAYAADGLVCTNDRARAEAQTVAAWEALIDGLPFRDMAAAARLAA